MLFKSEFQCKGHMAVCERDSRSGSRCQFCTVRFKNALEKAKHEAQCDVNPELFCEYCHTKLKHQGLRQGHMRRCPKHPKRMCTFCNQRCKSFAETAVHEALCVHNPAAKAAERGECTSCSETAQCLR